MAIIIAFNGKAFFMVLLRISFEMHFSVFIDFCIVYLLLLKPSKVFFDKSIHNVFGTPSVYGLKYPEARNMPSKFVSLDSFHSSTLIDSHI